VFVTKENYLGTDKSDKNRSYMTALQLKGEAGKIRFYP
jgi:hypothetical protein